MESAESNVWQAMLGQWIPSLLDWLIIFLGYFSGSTKLKSVFL